jgi:hypothetical protein
VSIALYTKPYKHYKSGFEAIRAENKPKVDCGLFALELCHHNNPAKIKFRQDKMREHFQKCLEQKKLTQFPRELEDVENVDYNLYKFNRPQLKPL